MAALNYPVKPPLAMRPRGPAALAVLALVACVAQAADVVYVPFGSEWAVTEGCAGGACGTGAVGLEALARSRPPVACAGPIVAHVVRTIAPTRDGLI